MRVLIAEDNFISRNFLQKALSQYGSIDVAIDGEEAVEAFKLAHKENKAYDVILMDIMMPNLDGIEALKSIREIEYKNGIYGKNECKVIMITAIDNPKSVIDSYYLGGATSYLIKPIDLTTLIDLLKKLELIS